MRLSFSLKSLVVSGLMAIMPLTAVAQAFWDVPQNYKYSQAIEGLTGAGVINGYPDGSFRPTSTINRAEAVKLMMAGTKPPAFIDETKNELLMYGDSTIPFPDVSARDWFAPYVQLAYRNRVVSGYPNGFFVPGNTLNFAEGLKIILLAYGADVSRIRFREEPLLAVKSDDWFARYFMYALNNNLINPNKFYHPAQPMTRGEFAEILYRLKTIKEEGLDEFPPPAAPPYSEEYTITIPALNIVDVKVLFADPLNAQQALAVLKNGLGHYLAPPGSGQKMVIFGHSSGYSWDASSYTQVLRQIDRLQNGDRIYLNYHEKGYIYEISNHEIVPARELNKVLTDYGYEELAMYTCWPPDSTAKRYIVYAGRVD